MKTELIVALISFAGVVAAAAISWIVSRIQVNGQIEKIRHEINKEYSNNLHKQRLQDYPELSALVENMTASIQERKMDHQQFCESIEMIKIWYINRGQILSANSNTKIYPFIRFANNISKSSHEAFKKRILDDTQRRDLIRKGWEIIIALKNDIGIFSSEFFDPNKKFSNFIEIDEELGSKSKP